MKEGNQTNQRLEVPLTKGDLAIILDCCFSGAFDPSLQSKGDDGSLDLQGQLGAEGRVVLTSSSSTQYSFEQQGLDLSLYTRYLIEGIETGAADRDEDGKISVRELYEYATSKVQETAPSMTPRILVLKDMGFDIVLAKAKVTDPKLRYRKTASRYYDAGKIRPIGRAVLNTVRQQLGLTDEEATEIENELLRPFQERLANLKQYRETLIAEAEHEYPLGDSARDGLNELQKMFGLRDEDVLPIYETLDETLENIRAASSHNNAQSFEVSTEIENELLRPFQERLANLKQYRETLIAEAEHEYPLGDSARDGLNELQKMFGLRDEDVLPIYETLDETLDETLENIRVASSHNNAQSFEVSTTQSTLEETKNMVPPSSPRRKFGCYKI